MKINKKGNTTGKVLFFIVLFGSAYPTIAQRTDSTRMSPHFGGAVTITTKGISIIPNLTLGKPAAIFDMSVGRRLSFEPQFRFSLEGQPWSFVFWWRFDFINTNKFLFKIGAHPAIAFRPIIDSINGNSREIMRAQRYLAAELVPAYLLTKNIGIGFYYLYSHGIEKDITQHTNYLGFRLVFSNINISDRIFMRFNPQVYYLSLDENDGYYLNATFALIMRSFPLSITSLLNKTIQTEIPLDENFLWNVSLVYTFNKKYREL